MGVIKISDKKFGTHALLILVFLSLVVFLSVGGWKYFAPWMIQVATGTSAAVDKLTLQLKQQLNPQPTSRSDDHECNRIENKDKTTPMKIECAFLQGEITEEQRILYLSYAVGDFEKLPNEFGGNVGWRGTSTLLELNEIVTSKEDFCKLSEFAQSELRLSFTNAVSCK